VEEVFDDFVVDFVGAELVGVDFAVLESEDFEFCEVLAYLPEFLLDFSHPALQGQQGVGFGGFLQFLRYGFPQPVASIAFGYAENHFLVDFFRQLHGDYSVLTQRRRLSKLLAVWLFHSFPKNLLWACHIFGWQAQKISLKRLPEIHHVSLLHSGRVRREFGGGGVNA